MFKPFTVIVPVISEKEFDLRAYGAVGDGRTSNTEAFRKAIEAAAADGGRVVVPNGIWLTGPIGLLSNVELHLMDNAVILFDKNPEEYPLVMTDYEGVTRIRTRSPIYAENAENIAITGKGIINGNIDSDVGIRFKSAMGRGGVVEEIYFENILMIGDAWPDVNAARSNGVWYYPILTRREGESWTEFKQTYFDKFLQDGYGDCQQELMDRFEQNFMQQGE